LNRLKQTGSFSEDEVRLLETSIDELNSALAEHKQTAQKSHKYHLQMVEGCSTAWKRISELETKSGLSENETEELDRLRNIFCQTISADYQMSKLIPSWGMSPQPGSTYYLQKLSNDIFGIVDHSTGESQTYIFDERLGPKNSDHTISYIYHYLSSIPPWIKRVHIFLGNAGSTNKNMYVMAWAMDMVQHEEFDIA